MRWKNTTHNDLNEVIKKLSLVQNKKRGRSPHPVYWFYLDKKKLLRITMPNPHGGSGSLSTGFISRIIKNLRLSNRQFEDLIDCPLSLEDFEVLVKAIVR